MAATFAAVNPAGAVIERTVEKSFPVSGAGRIALETEGGAITIVPGPDGVVKITARERIVASSDSEADTLLEHLELAFDQSGNDVHAKAKYERPSFGFHRGPWPPVQVEFVATVPASYAADLHTSGGGIKVGDLAGAVKAHTSGGPIALGKIGGTIEARTTGGGITVAEAADETKLDSSGGSISVGRLAGPGDLGTSGGGIRIDAVEHSVRAHTSGGSIRAGFPGALKGNCSLSTSGGSVRVTVAKAAAFHLDASTTGGGVSADDLTITLNHAGRARDKLVGDVNGGGPSLILRSSGGGIGVQAN
jgi:hypothetical protein